MRRAGKERALRDRRSRTYDLRARIDCMDRILCIKQRQQLLRPFRNGHTFECFFPCLIDDGRYNAIHKLHLGVQTAAVILHVLKPAFDDFCYIFSQDFSRFSVIDRRSLTALVRYSKLSIQSFADNLFV